MCDSVQAIEMQDSMEAALQSYKMFEFSQPRPPPELAGDLLTLEQLRIVNFDPPKGTVSRVLAMAGTGKTTTLICFAKARGNSSILYLCFNKKLKLEAERKFAQAGCTNVECRYWRPLCPFFFASLSNMFLSANSRRDPSAVTVLSYRLGNLERECTL